MAKGKILVDEKYKWLLDKYKWRICNNKNRNQQYVGRTEGKHVVFLHRVIMSLEEKDPLFLFRTKIYVDHINGNGLDNRLCNIRIASNSLNQINKKIQCNNTSGYKSVTRQKNGKYMVRFTTKDKGRLYGGLFDCKHEAAKKYNEMVTEIWGSNVILNVINKEVCHR